MENVQQLEKGGSSSGRTSAELLMNTTTISLE
jgi:hypothetical protein